MHKIAGFFLLLFTCLSFSLQAQQEEPERYLEVRGMSELDMEPLSRANVTLYEGDVKVKTIQTASDGTFSFKLDINKVYFIEISKEGLVSKRISFNTQMPAEEKGTWMNEFSMGLVKPCSGIDYSILKQPVDQVKFDPKRREFISDKDYVNSMRPRMEALMMKNDQCLLDNYESLVKKADQQASQKNYQEAINTYKEAIKIYPTEEYPAKKVTELNAMINKQQFSAEAYQKVITEADALLAQGKTPEALQKYKQASVINPQESYPKQKVTEIETRLDQQNAARQAQLNTEDRFNQAMAKASVAYTRKDYATAKQHYQEALTIKPSESLPKARVQEIETIQAKKAAEDASKAEEIARKAAAEKEYINLVAQADELFKAKKYDEAKAAYAKAMNMKPAESYPAQRIKTIDNAVATEKATLQKSRESQYNDAMTAANTALAKSQFQLARDSYQKALTVKPDDLTAKSKLSEVDRQEEEFKKRKGIEEQYTGYIQSGDALMAKKEWNAAKESYVKAIALKPADKYAQTKITSIENTLAAEQAALLKTKNDNYTAAISAGNNALMENRFALARESFQKALAIKPEDQVAKGRLSETEKLEAQYNRQKSVNEQYQNIIKNADVLLASRDLVKARESYTQALQIKPGDAYAQQKIASIDNTIAVEQAALLKSKNESYNSAMATGNEALAKNQFSLARELFQKAISVKPEDQVAKGRLAETDKLEAQFNRQKSVNEQYQSIIKNADGLLASRDLLKARESYTQALQIKQGDAYAQQKIASIDNTIAVEQAALLKSKNESFNSAMATGNEALAKNQFSLARESFQKAISVKPEDQVAKGRLAETDKLEALFNKQKSIEEQYRKIIQTADGLLAAKDLSKAKESYLQALQVKAGDQYAQQKIVSIDNTIAAEQAAKQKSIEDNYQAAIGAANTAITQKMYSLAKSSLQKALTVKPGDVYATGKMAEVDRLIADEVKRQDQEKQLNAQYKETITTADKYFNDKDMANARNSYTRALQIKPNDGYASQRIIAIDNQLAAEQAERTRKTEEAYTAAMTRGNNALNAKDYKTAQEAFQLALTTKPSDNMAKQKLSETGLLIKQEQEKLAAEQARKSKYQTTIQQADQLFAQKNYTMAKASYEQALAIMPSEAYPRQRIDESVKLIADQEKAIADAKAKDLAYNQALVNADKFYKAKDYDQAKNEYNRALALKPAETLPKQKLTEIEGLIAARQKEIDAAKARTESYTLAINTGKTAFEKKEYLNAKNAYTEALKYIPGDALATEQIKKIDYLMVEADKMQKAEQERKAAVLALVTSADKLFDGGRYPEAKENYRKILVIEPGHAYSKQRIAKIDEISRILAQSQAKSAATTNTPVTQKSIAAIPMGELNFKTESERQKYLDELKTKYPAGITLEKYKEQYKETYRYIIIREDQASEFRFVKFTTYSGAQYSVNGKPITQQYFLSQTKPRPGESFKEIEM